MERDRNSVLSSRIKLLLIIVAGVIILIGSVFLYKRISQNMIDGFTRKISEQYSQDLNAQMSTHIYSYVDRYFSCLDMMYSVLPAIDRLNEQKLEGFISRYRKREGLSFLAFADDEGYIYTADGSYLGTMRISILGRLLSGETRIISDNETVGSKSFILFGTSYSEPVRMDDRNLCIALLGISNEDISNEIVLKNSFSGGYSSIIHKDGSYVIKNPSSPYSGINVYESLSRNDAASAAEIEQIRKAVDSSQSYMLDARGNDEQTEVYLYFAPITGTDWYVVNTIPGSFIKTNIEGIQNRLAWISVIIILIFVTAALSVLVIQTNSSRKLRKSKEELARALEDAEIASEAKTTFLFSMSHDIRTPLNAILGYAGIGLSCTDEPDKSRDCYHKIMAASRHLLDLINDILEMSRVESGKMKLEERPVDLRQAISVVDHMSHSLAEAKSIDYQTVLGNIRNPYIYADELHINEIIINLVSNAVKYTPENGTVRYSIEQTGDVIDGKVTFRFEVSDNGIGMSEEFQKHLFETFTREESVTVSQIEGTGLGLSIVKRIVDLAGGTIHVVSEQKKGSTFSLEIPFRVMDAAAVQAFEAENSRPNELNEEISFAGRRVLLVEDNEMNREIATYILEDVGFLVETAENGQLALEAVSDKGTRYYDFILMDVQMPVMNGYEATRAIRALPDGGWIPIIALSANAFEDDISKSLESGMNAHVAKPIDSAVLMETLAQYLHTGDGTKEFK